MTTQRMICINGYIAQSYNLKEVKLTEELCHALFLLLNGAIYTTVVDHATY